MLMIRRCDDRDFEQIWAIINDGAGAYKGVIPENCWTEPYMSKKELQDEIDEGVVFWGYEESGRLAAVMGHQQVQDVTLIRHALCSHQPPEARDRSAFAVSFAGAGEECGVDRHLADATWAIRFYE